MSTSAGGSGRVSRRQLLQASGAAAAIGGLSILPFSQMKAVAQGTWDRETDVVVVGTGAAGAPAAIEAARAGAQVLRLEKVDAVGGNMGYSAGIIYLGGGTDLQLSHGFEDSVDGMVAYLEAWMGPWEDPEFIRFYAENSVEHYNWLVGEGVPFGQDFFPERVVAPPDAQGGLHYCGNELNYPYNEITPPVPRGHSVAGAGAAMSAALQESADAEPNITTELNAPVTNLITSDDGRVIGVVAEIEGQEQQILARRGVILASGGYEMNEEMLARTPAVAYGIEPAGAATRGNTGDGIRMAAGLGARLRDVDHTTSFAFVYPPEVRCQSILVDKYGRRFVNEADYGAVAGKRIVYDLEDGVAWLIMDATVAEAVEAAGGNVSEPDAAAETLEELATALDLPVDTFLNEVEFYNEQARAGRDPLFHKAEELLTPLETGPYMAFDFGTNTFVFLTAGHVEIDLDARVLDQNGNAISGLYAAGQGAAGIGRHFYNSGIRLSEGGIFGRVAGRNAAAESPWDGQAAVDTSSDATAPTPATTPEAIAASDDYVMVEGVDIAYNPTEISIPANTDTVIGLTNNGNIPHDLAIEGTDIVSDLAYAGDTVTVSVNLPAGEYVFYCTVPGHRQAGMEGTLIVG